MTSSEELLEAKRRRMKERIQPVIMLMLLPLSCAAAGVADWLQESSGPHDLDVLCEVQAIVQYRDKEGRFISMGMGTPISESELRTAAHVVNGATPGDEVLVAPCAPLRTRLGWSKGKITQVDRAMDVAILQLTQDKISTHHIPELCETLPSLHSPVLTLRVITDGTTVQSYSAAGAVVTSLTAMPPLVPDVDRRAGDGNPSLLAQVGLPRIVAAGTSISGASGGAIWDVRRRCVAGVTSAGIDFESLAEREETLRQAGDPPYASFLVGAPVRKAK